MITIYGRRNSSQVIQVMWTIGELGLDHVRHNVGGTFGGLDTDEYKKLNPNGLIPTIEDDGFVLWESYAIVRYLSKQYGKDSLWPTSNQEVARADQWMEWTNSRFMDAFFPAFWQLIRTPAEDQDLEKVKKAEADTGVLLQIVENVLQDQKYIAGNSLTMGDIPLGAMMFKYFSLEIDRPALPNIESWYARLCDREAYQLHAMVPFGKSSEDWFALERAGA